MSVILGLFFILDLFACYVYTTNRTCRSACTEHAEVAELADAHDSNSCSLGSEGSIPSFGTAL